MVARTPPKRKRLPKTREQILAEARAEWNDWQGTFLSAIPKGYLDDMLDVLLEALRKQYIARHKVDPFMLCLEEVRRNGSGGSTEQSILGPGDTFLPKGSIRPKYLAGRRFVVVRRLQKNYRVRIDDRTGIEYTRFGGTSGTITMPVSLIDWSTIVRRS